MDQILLNLLVNSNMLKVDHQILSKLNIENQFFAEITFGRPSKDCVNFGICRVDPVGQHQIRKKCKWAVAQAIVTIFNPYLIEFDFLKSSISPAAYQKFFSKAGFLVEEEFLQKNDNCAINIKVGNYPIIENDRFIKVVF